jgi:ribosomal protein L4
LIKSFQNIKNITNRSPEKISAIDVITNDYILITKGAFSELIKDRI